jgi:hypothetical protein
MLVWLGTFLLIASTSHATTILAVWTPERMVIGADAREGDRATANSVCKITIADNTFWAWSGIARYDAIHFRFSEILSPIMYGGGTLEKKLAELESIAIPKIVSLVAAVRSDPNEKSPHWKEGEGVIEILFGSIDQKPLQMYVVEFVPRTQPDNSIVIIPRAVSCPSLVCDNGYFVRLGQHDLIDQEISRDPQIWNRLGFEGTIERFIENEIAALPDHVGPPIAILTIANGTMTWKNSGACGAR